MDLGMFLMGNTLDTQVPLSTGSNFSKESLLGGEQNKDFMNLLDLVEGLEVAELSSASSSEKNWQNSLELVDDFEARDLGLLKHKDILSLEARPTMANSDAADKAGGEVGGEVERLSMAALPQLNVGVVQKEVGQTELRPQFEISSDSLKTLALDKELLASAHHFQVQQQMPAKLAPESVAAWTTALSSGELSSIDLSAVDQGSREVLSKNSQVLPMQVQEAVADPEADKVSIKAEGLIVGAKKPLETQPQIKTTSSLDLNPVKNTERLVEGTKPETQEAKDFIFDRGLFVAAGAQGRNVANSQPSETQMSSKVDAQAIDFVADKVSELQKMGGGTIKIGLDTKDAGQLQIKVSLRGGQVDVQIDATDATLRNELNLKKPELLTSLRSKVDLGRVEIASFASATQSSQLATGKIQAQQMMASSEVIKNMAGPDLAESFGVRSFEKSDVMNTTVAASDESSLGSSLKKDSQGFARDQRREQAMGQWANFSDQMKKSA
jgi:hypothetical protein